MTNIVPLTAEKFSQRSWQRFDNMKFASRDIISVLSAREVSRAILSLPIGFIQSQGNFKLAALQGLEDGKNLLIDDNGYWRGGYLPHQYHCHPFVMLKNDSDKLILCIDEDSDLLDPTDSDCVEPFFDAEKEPTELVKEAIEFLRTHSSQLEASQEICNLLNQHGLIKPWPLQVTAAKGQILLDEFFCIDEERLNSLSAISLKNLRNGDALTVAYAQLFSMLNVQLLVDQLNQDAPSAGAGNTVAPEIKFEDPESGGLINFDNI